MTTEIYSEVKGKGHNIVLLHGWGMHGGLWGKFNELLAKQYRTHAIDLPGFGYSTNVKNEFTLDAITEEVETYIKNIEQPVTLIGWSLGGLISLNILKRKNIKLNEIVLIATSPCFTKKAGWNEAMEQSVFNEFSADLKVDYKKTLKRFLSLQTRGSDLARDDLRELNKKLNDRSEPNIDALESGLKILSDSDLRNIHREDIAAMIILGEKDTLVPVSVKVVFKKIFPNSEQLVLAKTGHAPFISNPEICAEKIKNFIHE